MLVQDLSELNMPRGTENLPKYQILFNAMYEGHALEEVKSCLLTFVYDEEFPRDDVEKIRQLLDLIDQKFGPQMDDPEVQGETHPRAAVGYVREHRNEVNYGTLRNALSLLDVRDIFALGW